MAKLEFKGLRKSFAGVETIHGVDLTIDDGDFCVFVGPSGCGKSTLLRLVAGLESITDGELHIGERVVNAIPPAGRGVAMVFQSYALYPHMTVYRNMAFGLKAPGGGDEVKRRVMEAARMLELEPLLERLPSQLSGGQRQRVAIGRAIVRQPEVFLFDEPLSNLDAALRIQTRMEIARLHNSLGNTMIYVTHDQVEAMTLADKIVVLNDGYIEQAGAPLDLYHYPKNLFVATFLGAPQMNLIEGEVVEADASHARVRVPGSQVVEARVDASSANPGDRVKIGIRPENLAGGDPALQALQGTLMTVEPLGESTLLHVALPEDGGHLIARHDGAVSGTPDQPVTIRFAPETAHLFDAQGNAFRRHFDYAEAAEADTAMA